MFLKQSIRVSVIYRYQLSRFRLLWGSNSPSLVVALSSDV